MKQPPKRYDPLYAPGVPELLALLRSLLADEKGVSVSKADAVRIALAEAVKSRSTPDNPFPPGRREGGLGQ